MRLVAFLATASRRAANGNNDRLSTPWREVISLAGVARSISRAWLYRDFGCRDRHAHHGRSTPISRRSPLGKVRISGLGQVQRFVQERGGAVEIKSEVGVGTAVRMMMLPVS